MGGIGVQLLALLIRHALTAAGLAALLDSGGVQPEAVAGAVLSLAGVPAEAAPLAGASVLAVAGLGWSAWRKLARLRGAGQ